MSRADRIRTLLEQALAPNRLEVIDESSQHAGHAGARPQGETHYRIRLAAPQLEGLSRVAAHRKINELLQPEFDSGLHALAIEVG